MMVPLLSRMLSEDPYVSSGEPKLSLPVKVIRLSGPRVNVGVPPPYEPGGWTT